MIAAQIATVALAALLPAAARDVPPTYSCEIKAEEPFGTFEASATLDHTGAAPFGDLRWISPYFTDRPSGNEVTIWRYWDPSATLHSLLRNEATIDYRDGKYRKGQGIRIEIRGTDAAHSPFAASDATKTRKNGFASFGFDWDRLAAFARTVPAVEFRTISLADGAVLARGETSAAQLAQVEGRVAGLQHEFAAMLADYKHRCSSSADVIVVVD